MFEPAGTDFRLEVKFRNVGFDVQQGCAIQNIQFLTNRRFPSILSSLTTDNPIGLGRVGARVAKMP